MTKRPMYFYLDDERKIDSDAIEKKGYECLIFTDPLLMMTALDVYKDREIIVDLDHDLGGPFTGYDVCKYIISHQIPLEGFIIHSMNPVGVFNMRQLLTHYGYYEVSLG